MVKLQQKHFIISLIIILALFTFSLSQEIQISASVDNNPVGVNEQFSYQVEISGETQNLPNVDLPDFSDFAVMRGPSTSSSFQIVNFDMKASKTYTIVLMPKKEGTFRIAPAKASYKGKTISSNSVDVKVVKETQRSQQQQQQAQSNQQQRQQQQVDLSKAVFLKVIPSKRSLYVNEEVTLRYKIYFRVNISGNEVEKLPEAVGAWVEEYPMPQQPKIYQETVDGVQYNVAEIRKVAVFPSRPGKITVSPMSMIVEAVVRRQRTRDPFNMFDDFFGDPFGQVVKQRINSGGVELNVLPLPESGKPNNFSGLVGDFKVHSSVDKETVPANEAISYKIKISGRGLLKFLEKLPVTFSPDFEVYDPKIDESVSKSGPSITSNKEFDYVIIPRVAGEQRIKPVQLSYFNPGDKKYHYLSVPEYKISVTPGKDLGLGVGSGTVLSKEEVQLLGEDIRFIKENIGDLKPVGYVPYKQWWFYLAFIFPTVLLGVAWGYRNHLEKMSTNVQYARSRKAHKQAQARLREAKTFLKQQQPAQFYGAISASLIGYVADKTNRPAAGLLRDEVIQLLRKNKVEQSLEADYLKCLDEADFRRFAPGEAASGEMQEFYRQTEKVLVGLEKYF